MSTFDHLYAKLPVLAQHMALSGYGFYWKRLCFGNGYQMYLQEYLEREHFTERQWKSWQAEQLRNLLQACVNHVPYYREHWSETQKHAALKGDLSALPLLEKDPIRANPKSFLREDMQPSHPQVFLTSGSTGTPISSYYTVPELRQSLAVREVRSARWAGVSFSLPRVTFSGRMVSLTQIAKVRSIDITPRNDKFTFPPFTYDTIQHIAMWNPCAAIRSSGERDMLSRSTFWRA